MKNSEMNDVITALRRRVDRIEGGPGADAEPSKALTKSVQRTLFLRGGLGPVESILARACRDLDATLDWPSMADSDLLKLWSDTVERLALHFSQSPESWLDPESEQFMLRSAIVFGIEEGKSRELMRTFHRRPKDERFAVFLPIRRSPLFSYIDEQIQEMVDDIDIADPDESFRSLIRSVSSTA